MYKNGELDRVMAGFEKTLKTASVWVCGSTEHADKFEVMLEDGRTSMRYRNGNYYNNHNVNQAFVLYLHGYSSGKCEGRLEV